MAGRSTTHLNELDSLLMELDSIEDPQSRSSTSAPSPKQQQASAADWDELDDLVSQFDTHKPTSSATPPPAAPKSPTPVRDSQPPPSNRTSTVPSSTVRPVSPPQQPPSATPNTSNPSYPGGDVTSRPPVSPPTNNGSNSDTRDLRKTVRMSVYNPGTSASSSQLCGKCAMPVPGEHMLALGKIWHVNHLCCAQCGMELRGEFYDNDAKPTCKACMEALYRCDKCGSAITGEYYLSDGRMLHSHCLERHSCAKCGQVITTEKTIALEKYYHPNCFTCTGCQVRLLGTFYNKANQPYCTNCANSNTNPTAAPGGGPSSSVMCHSCRQGIKGAYVAFEGKTWHESCFTCSSCRNSLSPDAFYTVNGQPTCQHCATSL